MTAIVGANGTGKSTLLEAITFALFGEQRHNKDSIKFHWAGPKERFRVELTFEFGGRRHVVERGERAAELRADGNVVAEGLREVKTACEKLLRLSHDQFINSFCAEQKSLDFLKFKDRSTRQNEVARMLGLDKLRDASEIAKTEGRRCKDKIAVLEEEMANRERLERDLTDAKSNLEQEARKREEAAKERAAAETRIAPARQRGEEAVRWLDLHGELQELRAEGSEVNAARNALGEEIERLGRQCVELASLEETERHFQQLKREMEEQERLLKAASDFALRRAARNKEQYEAERIRARLAAAGVSTEEQIDETVAAHTPDLEAVELDHRRIETEWRNAQQAATRRLSESEARLAGAKEALGRSKTMVPGTACPECGQTIRDDYSDLVQAREAAVREAEEGLRSSAAEAESLKAPPAGLGESADRLRLARDAQAKARAQGDALRKELALLKELESKGLKAEDEAVPAYREDLHAQLKERLAALESKHDRYVEIRGAKARREEALKEQAKTQARFLELKARSDALKAQQTKLGFQTASEAETARAEFGELQLQIGKLLGDAQNQDRLVQVAQRAVEAAEKRMSEFETIANRVRGLKLDRIHFETVSKEMLSLREALNQQIRPDLQSRASDNLLALSGGRYTALELDEQFEPTVLDDGVQKAVISGGEEDIVALSLRLALSELIQERQGTPLCLLILDEVFGSLDAARRQSVMERLSGLKGRFEQILVISHIEEINQVADHCIYLTRDEGTKSTYVSDAPLGEAPYLLL